MSVDGDSNTSFAALSGPERLIDALGATEQNSNPGSLTNSNDSLISNPRLHEGQDQLNPWAFPQHSQSNSLPKDSGQPVSFDLSAQNNPDSPNFPEIGTGQSSLTHNGTIDSLFVHGNHDLVPQHDPSLIPPHISGDGRHERQSPAPSTPADVLMTDVWFRTIENIDLLASPQDAVSNIILFPNIPTDLTSSDATFATKRRMRTSKEVRMEGRLRSPESPGPAIVCPARRLIYSGNCGL